MFISFEGIDGSGKGTQIKLFAEYLQKKGIDFVIVREPGGTEVGELIRSLLLNSDLKIYPRTELLLFLASRAQIVDEVILPALRAGKTVISDRFIDSSVAYQGVGRGIGFELVEELNRFATSDVKPDLTFYLDITPETSLKRKMIKDRMEKNGIEFLNKVREAYLMIAQKEPNRVVVINGERNIDEIHAEIVEIFEKRSKSL
ncbi:dTMP kinase [Pseudothermotoga thermarum]|uniref:Thymidylate kinase n=1 Tax=Pseudothermotoga thermarum DSM 5069 TaxID=688269 RepID=F7YYB1_9THEM|nr:dTMP kinase [Pseudothermotoga thermarum]AEH50932.1 thymidylate kinase [Pseudothermotoga thermarum DSM 5069]